MSAVALLADEQARLEATPIRRPPASLAEVTTLAARLDAETQQALWHIGTTPPGSAAWAAARAAYRERSWQARRMYWYKRILIGWRHPGAFLCRGALVMPAPVATKGRGGGMNAEAARQAAEGAARLAVAQAALDAGATPAEAARVAGYASVYVLRNAQYMARKRARKEAA